MSSTVVLIFVGFLLTNLIVGLYCGRHSTTMSEYAVATRNFSLLELVAAIVTCWITGSFFFFTISEAYSQGLPFILLIFGYAITIIIFGYFYVPRMGRFLGNQSISQVMGQLYGRRVRLLTAVSGVLLTVGLLSLQIKLLTNIIEWILGAKESYYLSILTTCIVVFYLTAGGIKSLVSTAVLQCILLLILIPTIAVLIVSTASIDYSYVPDIISLTNALDEIFTWKWLSLLLWLLLPGMSATIFQRVLIARSTTQASRALILGGLISIIIIAILIFIAIALLFSYPNFSLESPLLIAVAQSGSLGKIILLICVATMVIGSGGAALHTGSTQFALDIYDYFAPCYDDEHRLLIARISAAIIGVASMSIALASTSLFKLTLLMTNFYMPIVTIPLTMVIFGFRPHARAVLFGMVCGIASVIYWRVNLLETGIDSVVPGTIANFCGTIFYHCMQNTFKKCMR